MTACVVKPNEPYQHEYGDIIYGTYSDRIIAFNPDLIDGMNVLHLSYFNRNYWRALRSLPQICIEDVIDLYKDSRYVCPITERAYSALLPLAIRSNDVGKYFSHFPQEPWFREIACGENRFLEISTIGTVMMGPGYTLECSPNDGSFSYVQVLIQLSNGDYLDCVTLVWHNK